VSARRIMIVTASKHQCALIEKAKALGHEVLATDIRADAPGLKLADQAVVVDAADRDELLRVAREYAPRAIVSEQTDVAVAGVAYAAEQLGLVGIGYDVALRATDKWRMREACRSAGLPTPKYRLATSVAEAVAAAREVGFPVIAKPTDNQGCRGVTRVTDLGAMPAAAERAFAASRSNRVLVEECMTGREGSIESFVIGDAIHILGICDHVKCAPPYSFNLQMLYPGDFPTSVTEEIKRLNGDVIRSVGIKMGFAHAEFIVTDKGVRLIEIAARGCGARIATDLLPVLTGVDLLELRLRQAIGEAVHLPNVRTDLFGICRFFELPAGTVKDIRGLREAAAVEGAIHLEFTPVVGARLGRATSADQRAGFVLAAAAHRAQVLAIVDEVERLIEVDMA
jgi:biotin carboxylase